MPSTFLQNGEGNYQLIEHKMHFDKCYLADMIVYISPFDSFNAGLTAWARFIRNYIRA